MGYKKLIEKLGETGEQIIKSEIPFDEIREILINVGCKAKIYSLNRSFSIGKTITQNRIQDMFAALCDYSVHTYKDEIIRGFITAENGFRVGICGTAVYENKNIIGIKDISALNIRIPHQIYGIADKIIQNYKSGGILIIGPPCSGKTTMLRELSRLLSRDNKIVVIDERFEIAGTVKGKPYFDIGNSSVLSGFYKKDGMEFVIRAMAPQIIICDEFGGKEDLESCLFAMKSGCDIVASMHAFDFDDFINKNVAKGIIESGIFKIFVFLNRNCNIEKIMNVWEIPF